MSERSPVLENRKARHDYEVLETLEAGLVLEGSEVKSIRAGKANLQDSFARVEHEEVFAYHLHISAHETAGYRAPDPFRVRKLLLHRAEIRRLSARVREKGLTLIPLKLYFKNGRVKVLLGVAKGRPAPNKRRHLKEKAARRDAERALASRTRKPGKS